MFKVTKEVRWEAAHRLLNYEGKCANIHGHSYRAIFTFESKSLNEKGMVIDFKILKEKIQGWLDENWDHALILCDPDPLLKAVSVSGHRHYALNGNPTAENMAEFLFLLFEPAFPGITLVSVEVFEGSKSSAIYEK